MSVLFVPFGQCHLWCYHNHDFLSLDLDYFVGDECKLRLNGLKLDWLPQFIMEDECCYGE